MTAKTPRLPEDDGNHDPNHPFHVFMTGILDIYHVENIREPRQLDERAHKLLELVTLPQVPPEHTAESYAKALVERADLTPGDDANLTIQWVIDALRVWPDCAEAYMFTARIIEGREHAITLMQPFFTLALEALHRRLPEGVRQTDGTVRDIPEAAMYLRALCGLGEALATQGRFTEAVASYVESLRLDPEDRENVRPRLALCELLLGQKAAADARIKTAKPGLITAYVQAFVNLALKGDGAAPRQALAAARGLNPHLFPMLTEMKKMPGMLTNDEEYDAAQYACLALAPAFLGRTGLRDWLKYVGRAGHTGHGPSRTAPKKKRRR